MKITQKQAEGMPLEDIARANQCYTQLKKTINKMERGGNGYYHLENPACDQFARIAFGDNIIEKPLFADEGGDYWECNDCGTEGYIGDTCLECGAIIQ